MISKPKAKRYSFKLYNRQGGEQTFIWPASDGYNPDHSGDGFTRFVSEFFRFGAESDQDGGSDQLYNRYLPSSLQEDEQGVGERMKALVKVWGRSFDDVHYATQNLGRHHIASNQNSGLGVDHRNRAWAQSGYNTRKLFDSYSRELVFLEQFLAEELYLKHVKGTRESINAFLALVGIIPGLVELTEYVSVAQRLSSSSPLHPNVEAAPALESFLLEENLFEKDIIAQGFTLHLLRDNRKSWVVKPGGAQMYTDIYFGASYPAPSPLDVVNRKFIRLTFKRDAVLQQYPEGSGKSWFTTEVDRQIELVKSVYMPFIADNLLPVTVVLLP